MDRSRRERADSVTALLLQRGLDLAQLVLGARDLSCELAQLARVEIVRLLETVQEAVLGQRLESLDETG